MGTTAAILKNTGIAAGCAIVLALLAGEPSAAIGFAIGALLAIFSLFSLMIVVPRLCARPGPSTHAGLGLMLILKTPIYAAVLFFAMTSRLVNPLAVFAGVAILPSVVCWQALIASLSSRTPSTRSSGMIH
jgi:hypothetical protein